MAARTIHPFPARMAPGIALECMSSGGSGKRLTVLDPMCGSGTVLSLAIEQGHVAKGFDVDPLAVLMSTVAVRAFNTGDLASEAAGVVARARRSRVRLLPWTDDETTDFAYYWFGDEQRSDLNRVSRQINEIDDVALREVLQISLSRIIVSKSPMASLAADTAHSRPHRVIDSSTFSVLDGFLASVRQVQKLLDRRTINGRATARRGDARALKVSARSIDLIVTSPPYLNAIDYLRGHRLALIWMGYNLSELRQIRAESVGAERALSECADARVKAMVGEVEAAASEPSLLPRGIVTRYARDLVTFASEMFRVCRPGAQVVMVVGNSTLRGNFIQNDRMLVRALEHAGFTKSASQVRELPESHRYMPVGARGGSPLAKRMRTETILSFFKAG